MKDKQIRIALAFKEILKDEPYQRKGPNRRKKESKMKNGQKKQVLKHLKEDTREFKEQIKDDKKLAKKLKRK